MVREGKGKKDRIVPIGERAGLWISATSRRRGPRSSSSPTRAGSSCTSTVSRSERTAHGLVKAYIANVGRRQDRRLPPVPAHDGDVDARQRRRHPPHPGDPGPRQLSTTEIYTQVSIRKLKDVHALTHPADRPRARPPIFIDQSDKQ